MLCSLTFLSLQKKSSKPGRAKRVRPTSRHAGSASVGGGSEVGKSDSDDATAKSDSEAEEAEDEEADDGSNKCALACAYCYGTWP